MNKTTARIIKQAQQSYAAGHPMTIGELAKRHKLSQAHVFAAVVENNDLVDVEVGQVVRGEWRTYPSIGEYVVKPVTDWSRLLTALTNCRYKSPLPEVNDTIERLLGLLGS